MPNCGNRRSFRGGAGKSVSNCANRSLLRSYVFLCIRRGRSGNGSSGDAVPASNSRILQSSKCRRPCVLLDWHAYGGFPGRPGHIYRPGCEAISPCVSGNRGNASKDADRQGVQVRTRICCAVVRSGNSNSSQYRFPIIRPIFAQRKWLVSTRRLSQSKPNFFNSRISRLSPDNRSTIPSNFVDCSISYPEPSHLGTAICNDGSRSRYSNSSPLMRIVAHNSPCC